jgi:hypothetical protein
VHPDIRRYIATEAVRRYGPLEAGLSQRLRAYMRRNTSMFVDREEIQSTLALYKEVYSQGSCAGSTVAPTAWSAIRMAMKCNT